MKFKILSIKDVNTNLEKTDDKSMERKGRVYSGIHFNRGRAFMFYDFVYYTVTSRVVSDTNLGEWYSIIRTENSIYLLKKLKGGF